MSFGRSVSRSAGRSVGGRMVVRTVRQMDRRSVGRSVGRKDEWMDRTRSSDERMDGRTDHRSVGRSNRQSIGRRFELPPLKGCECKVKRQRVSVVNSKAKSKSEVSKSEPPNLRMEKCLGEERWYPGYPTVCTSSGGEHAPVHGEGEESSESVLSNKVQGSPQQVH